MKIAIEVPDWPDTEYLQKGELKMLRLAISNMAKRDDNTEKSRWIEIYRKIDRCIARLERQGNEKEIDLLIPFEPLEIRKMR